MTRSTLIGPAGTTTIDFPDIGLSGAVLDPEALTFTYVPGRQADGILFGISMEDDSSVVQFDMENAVKLRDKLNEIIEANT